jgi:small nuclear ribonucleoprotein (snRNP)-like protein
MSTENALITLLREGVSVQEASVDSKRDLEDCLRSACNDFIEHTSTSLLGPIAGLVDQCKNAVGSGTGSTDSLVKAAFMNAVIVKGIFSKADEALGGELENVSKQMNLYLENTATQSILLKPVVRKMTRALEEVKRFIGDVPDEENGWDAELRAEVMKLSESFEAKVKTSTSKPGAVAR